MSDKQYHHGALKDELIGKGVQLLAREGYEGFSLRKLASMCGVSHAAPYKHFKSKDEIITEISRSIAREFSCALQEAVGQYPADPRMQLTAMCRQYIRFMVEHPDYFRFIFMTAHGKPIELQTDSIGPGSREPFAIALKCAEAYFRPLHGEGWCRDFMAVWSMLQGYTLMLVCQTIKPEGDYLQLAQEMVEGYLDKENLNNK